MRLFFILIMGAACMFEARAQLKDTVFSQQQNLPEIEVQHQAAKDTSHCKAHAGVLTEDMLARIPEIQMYRRGAFAMEPNIRSYTAGQIQVSLEGMRLHGACTDRMDPVTSYIEPINLETIQVNTTADATRYGNALGGSIFLGLKKPVVNPDKLLSGQWSSTYGTNGSVQAHLAAINVSGKKAALRISSAYRNAGVYYDGAGRQVLFSQYEKYNILLSGLVHFANSSYLLTDFLIDEGKNIGYPALTMDVGLASAKVGSIELGKLYPGGNLISALKWRLYHQNVFHAMDDSHRPNVPIRMDMPGWSNTWGSFAEMELNLHPNHQILLRPEVLRHFSKADMLMYPAIGAPMYMLTWPDNVRYSGGLFITHEQSIFPNWHWYQSARIEAVQTQVLSEFGKDQMATLLQDGNYKPLHLPKTLGTGIRMRQTNWDMQLFTAWQERAPTVTELLGFYLYNAYDSYDMIGNNQLGTEKVWHTEYNATLRLKSKTTFQLGMYFDRVSNYIMGVVAGPDFTPMTIGARGVRFFQHVGPVMVTGTDAHLKWHIAERWRYIHTARYMRGWLESGENLPLISPLRNIHSLQYGTQHKYLRFESEWAAAQNHINPAYGEMATNGFVIFHLRANYTLDVGKTKAFVSIGIENLTNRLYREHLDWGGIPRPGRNVYANIGWAF